MEGSQYILACQKDSYLTGLKAKVLSCKEEGGRYEVVLNDTDPLTRQVVETCRGTDLKDVLACIRKDGCAVHILDRPLEIGKEVLVTVDWARRWSHMQQHTAQHLITAMCMQLHGWKTVSWNLGTERSSIDLACAQITSDEMVALEEALNSVILSRKQVTCSLYTRDSPELQAVYSRGIPDDVKGEVRVVSIGGIDNNTCCGTHVKDTGDLQVIKLLYSEKFKANTKLWFVAGTRVRKNLASLISLERQLQVKLQSPPSDFLDKINEVQQKLKNSTQYNKEIIQEIATMKGRESRQKVQTEGLKVICHHRNDGTPEYTSAFLVAFAGQELAKKGKQPALVFPCAVLLTTGEESGKEGGHIFLSGEERLVTSVEPIFAELLLAKGRANKGEYKGKAGSLEKIRRVQAEVERLFTF